jgi:hypothetical protein
MKRKCTVYANRAGQPPDDELSITTSSLQIWHPRPRNSHNPMKPNRSSEIQQIPPNNKSLYDAPCESQNRKGSEIALLGIKPYARDCCMQLRPLFGGQPASAPPPHSDHWDCFFFVCPRSCCACAPIRVGLVAIRKRNVDTREGDELMKICRIVS